MGTLYAQSVKQNHFSLDTAIFFWSNISRRMGFNKRFERAVYSRMTKVLIMKTTTWKGILVIVETLLPVPPNNRNVLSLQTFLKHSLIQRQSDRYNKPLSC